MKIKIGDLTIEQWDYICAQHIPEPCACKNCPLGFDGPFGHYYCSAHFKKRFNNEIELPDELLDNDEKEDILGTSVAVTGTNWNSQQGSDGYRLQFETNNKQLYKYMEKAAQTCIDIASANRKD